MALIQYCITIRIRSIHTQVGVSEMAVNQIRIHGSIHFCNTSNSVNTGCLISLHFNQSIKSIE